jgi:hypothetical protein
VDDPTGAAGYQFEYYGKPLDASSPAYDSRMATSVGFGLPTEFRELARVLSPWLYHSQGWAYFPKDIHALWEHRFLD